MTRIKAETAVKMESTDIKTHTAIAVTKELKTEIPQSLLVNPKDEEADVKLRITLHAPKAEGVNIKMGKAVPTIEHEAEAEAIAEDGDHKNESCDPPRTPANFAPDPNTPRAPRKSQLLAQVRNEELYQDGEGGYLNSQNTDSQALGLSPGPNSRRLNWTATSSISGDDIDQLVETDDEHSQAQASGNDYPSGIETPQSQHKLLWANMQNMVAEGIVSPEWAERHRLPNDGPLSPLIIATNGNTNRVDLGGEGHQQQSPAAEYIHAPLPFAPANAHNNVATPPRAELRVLPATVPRRSGQAWRIQNATEQAIIAAYRHGQDNLRSDLMGLATVAYAERNEALVELMQLRRELGFQENEEA